MPAKPQWLLKIPAILEQLRILEVPVLDRSICERIFGVRRRRAVELMHRFGGYQSGNTILLDRVNLIRQLEALGLTGDFGREQHRKARLAEKLDSLHQHRTALSVRIPVVPVATGILPDGIAFSDGRMTVEFAGVEELLSKLYSLSQAASRNFEAFRSAIDPKRN
jgi:hypothetical protein